MGDDEIYMDTVSTADAVGRVAAAGQTMTVDWRGVSAEITSLGGQLGRGDLGAAFLDGYRQPAAQVASDADRHCRRPGQLADLGNACVNLYRSADATGAGAIRAVNPETLG
jgi:hypothetical protein